eukprot:scaffold41314_cov47-Phaeocystis_antarctica.AAC.2
MGAEANPKPNPTPNQESMGAEADCTEAIYNLGVVSKRLGDHARALGLFEKLHAILPSSIEVRQSASQSDSQSVSHYHTPSKEHMAHTHTLLWPPFVVWQIADLFDISNQPRTAIKWFKILNARVPTDPGVLARI